MTTTGKGNPAKTGGPANAASKMAAPRSTSPVGLDPDTFVGVGGSRVEAFNMVLLRETVATIWVSTKEEKGQMELILAAVAALKGFRPTDEIEGMLAAQAVALHLGATV